MTKAQMVHMLGTSEQSIKVLKAYKESGLGDLTINQALEQSFIARQKLKSMLLDDITEVD